MTQKLITPPALEPLTIEELKAWCRIDHAAEDTLLAGLISAARELVERHVGAQLITQTWQVHMSTFPVAALELDLRPFQSVTAVSYEDLDDQPAAIDPATLRVVSDEWLTQIYPGANGWPITNLAEGNVVVTVTVGYGDAATDVPATLRQAISLIAAHWYENREESTPLQTRQIPMGAERLMSLHRVPLMRFA